MASVREVKALTREAIEAIDFARCLFPPSISMREVIDEIVATIPPDQLRATRSGKGRQIFGVEIFRPDELIANFQRLDDAGLLDPQGAPLSKKAIASASKKTSSNVPATPPRSHARWIEAIEDRYKTKSTPIRVKEKHIYQGEEYKIGNWIHRVREGRIKLTKSENARLERLGIRVTQIPRLKQSEWQEGLERWIRENSDKRFNEKASIEIRGHTFNLYNRDKALRIRSVNITFTEAERDLWLATVQLHRQTCSSNRQMHIVSNGIAAAKPSLHSTPPDTGRSLARATP
jgi:hypothetical protein